MRRLLLAAVGVGVVGVLAFGPGASAQAPTGTTITFTELDEGSTFRFIDHTPRVRSENNPRFSMGDQIVFTNPLANASGARIGKLHATCTMTVGGRFSRAVAVCTGAYRLQAGQLQVQVLTKLTGETTVGSVVGGTGAYANARGTFRSVTRSDDNSDVTVTLAP
jgi:hypothetical protein